jgi:hypothetical protein
MTEIWKPIPGYEGYYDVSTEGRVRGLARSITTKAGYTKSWPARDMIPRLNKDNGYPQVMLWRDGRGWTVYVHKLVAETFLGSRPDGKQCGHLDGDKRNARLSNLAWVTPAENREHQNDHGTSRRGERHQYAKLTEEQVREIRRRFDAGEPRKAMAREYGVSWRNLYNIARRESWRHI